ncbi:MAG: phospholipid carrier-dependent glycosyltransferase [Pseudomonadota bacterium]
MSRASCLRYLAATALAVFVYCFALDGQHIPKNGDEYPYVHITRMTAESGHLLPLQSALPGMRNTKPPLLFWQGIASTDWGQSWTLFNLRYPSLIYTGLTGLLVFLLAWRLSANPAQGFIALLSFLAFFSSYRFGRPFLTNPPEVFFLFLPFFILLYWRKAAFDSRALPFLLALIIGIGLLYKSFALLLPVGLALAWWYLHQRAYRVRAFIVADVWKLALIALLALSLFSLWFLLDPQPQAIWQEFVVQENVGKLDQASTPGAYWLKFFWGSSSLWTMLLGYPLNAGLLAFPVLALLCGLYKRRATLSEAEKLLCILLFVFVLVFSLPSQRSSRYLLVAMPALAVLCALGWRYVQSLWFALSLCLVLLVLAGLAYLSWRLALTLPGVALYAAPHWLLLAASAVFAVIALGRPSLIQVGSCIAVLLSFLSLASFLRPFEGDLGRYSVATQASLSGQKVYAPYDFNAKDEAYRFLLPGALIVGYREESEPVEGAASVTPQRLRLSTLRQRYPQLFAAQRAAAPEALHLIVRMPLGTLPCTSCRLIATRLDVRGRQSPQALQAILRGQVLANLFVQEMLLEVPSSALLAAD